MKKRHLLIGLIALAVLWPASVAVGDEGDPPTGPEACVVDRLNQRRAGAALSWSGTIQDELARHASRMAARGELGHDDISDRTSGIPDGWTLYGEASYAGSLSSADRAGVVAWCEETLDAFWGSAPHRRTLDGTGYSFVSVGTHWDGERIWVAVGVFAHPSYRPAAVDWPHSFTQGLVGAWDGRFYDDDDSMFQSEVEQLAASGITVGCNPPLGTAFCPDASVTRGEMAAFLARALGWEGADGDHFTDDDGSVFEGDIESLVGAGVTEGCNPPASDRFCPDRPITRAEMATFLGRALGLEPSPHDRFGDIAGSVHRSYINAAAEAGITVGCGTNRYCPDQVVTRGQMAAFLVRAGPAG
ncbi:MAG: S-layer homology domain-containing protein [Actinomycetota bacterium]